MTTVLLEHKIEMPAIRTLAEFRQWARSDDFPPRGRIDYIGGRLEVDVSPEDLFTHGTLKSELAARIGARPLGIPDGELLAPLDPVAVAQLRGQDDLPLGRAPALHDGPISHQAAREISIASNGSILAI